MVKLENSDIDKVLRNIELVNGKNKSKKDNQIEQELSSLYKIIKENENIDFTLALVLVLSNLVSNFEKKDIIPKHRAKDYAILSSTNDVQKDIINEIISKQNDNKGQTKEMYFKLILQTIKSLNQKENTDDKKSFLNRFGFNK